VWVFLGGWFFGYIPGCLNPLMYAVNCYIFAHLRTSNTVQTTMQYVTYATLLSNFNCVPFLFVTSLQTLLINMGIFIGAFLSILCIIWCKIWLVTNVRRVLQTWVDRILWVCLLYHHHHHHHQWISGSRPNGLYFRPTYLL